MATQTLMTAAQFDSLPECEGLNKELLDGELIEMPSATLEHNRILAILTILLGAFLKTTKSAIVVPTTEFAFGPERRLQNPISRCFFTNARQSESHQSSRRNSA